MPNHSNDATPYRFHRTALAPVLPSATAADMAQAGAAVAELGETPFAEFLCHQGLAPLWDECIEGYPGRLPLSAEFTNLVHRARLHATGNYLIQRHNLALVREILDAAGVIHVVTKGAHTREVYYQTPALRPATDIDVLVPPVDKLRAIKAFQAQGFKFLGSPENISHEASLLKGKTSIDLHWHILRPGRTREIIVETLLSDPMDYGSHWGMSAAGTLFMMLVHPVFTKYTTTPHATLVRLVDLALLLDSHPEALAGAEKLLERAGLKTAGWITAQWLHLLTANGAAANLCARLRPGPLRRWWLRNWLSGDCSSNLLERPWLIQLGFTLPAHDRWKDSARAIRTAWQCRRDGPKTLELLEAQLG